MTRFPPAFTFLAITAIMLASVSLSSATGSRFLAGLVVKSSRCSRNPAVCRTPGSGGPTCCANQCTDTSRDTFNCGRCGRICKFTDSCCEGKCIDVTFDKHNCGSCGKQCSRGVKCFYGLCQYA
ncbi:hypothetical protein IEQ34_011335 [Dendrobium chrysotoxum]|uniref:Stigma-specific STIG1-like protein 1 n=1 Tax=Dendrobium chrysotoxum TaxID=161865 RepID=A0AAV7GXH2_DENCH|nr:hypothetical protein IEQ34_011335 [Dendrobium chrysotoxum]